MRQFNASVELNGLVFLAGFIGQSRMIRGILKDIERLHPKPRAAGLLGESSVKFHLLGASEQDRLHPEAAEIRSRPCPGTLRPQPRGPAMPGTWKFYAPWAYPRRCLFR